jgi:hypothetical protein
MIRSWQGSQTKIHALDASERQSRTRQRLRKASALVDVFVCEIQVSQYKIEDTILYAIFYIQLVTTDIVSRINFAATATTALRLQVCRLW